MCLSLPLSFFWRLFLFLIEGFVLLSSLAFSCKAFECVHIIGFNLSHRKSSLCLPRQSRKRFPLQESITTSTWSPIKWLILVCLKTVPLLTFLSHSNRLVFFVIFLYDLNRCHFCHSSFGVSILYWIFNVLSTQELLTGLGTTLWTQRALL